MDGTAGRRQGVLETVLLGDWSRWVRDWSDVVRLSYLAGAGACFATGMTGHGVRMLLTFTVALLPRLLNTPRPFDLFFTATIGLQAWGNTIGWFHGGGLFDRFDHAFSLLGIAPLCYLWFVRLGLLRHIGERESRSHYLGLVVIGLCVGLACGAVYEIWEYVAIHALGAHIFVSEADTVWDLGMDAVGSAAGSVLLFLWAWSGWGTERRVPRPATT